MVAFNSGDSGVAVNSAPEAAPGLRSIVTTGNSANRVDIVFLGDGYTASQIATTYTANIQNYLSYIFDDSALTQPFGRYENFFNVYAVDVVSNQSGADDPTAGVVRDTALDASYLWDGATQRLLYVNDTKATTAMNNALSGTGISAEMRYVLVNDTQYGGGGGYFGVYAAGNSSARDVALHEIGHSFAGLADEYGGNTGTYVGSEPSQIDVTKNPTGAKWSEWLGYNDPVLGVVGAYEGGFYYDHGIYRPTLDSKMRDLGRPFDPIAREEFIHKFYQFVDPLDSYDNNVGIKNNVVNLSVDVIDPSVILVDWTVNGQTFVNAGETFNFPAHGLGAGSYTVTARAYDPTDWVRGDRSDLEESISWTVVNGSTVSTTVAQNDFNADGHSDILWQNNNGQAHIWSMNGTTIVSQLNAGGNPGPTWHEKDAGNFNADGRADILWQNDSGQAAIWLMNGNSPTSQAIVGGNPGPTWHIKAAGDFNGDGNADILWQNDNGQADIWLMNGTTPAPGVFVGGNPGPTWHIMAAADFNGDGKADILWQNDNGQADIWLMNGTTPAPGVFVGGNPGPTWHIKAAGDFNGDGKADILWQNDNGQADIWLMNGTTPAPGVFVGGNPGPSWHIKDAADFNGDGLADILWQNDNGQAAIWVMNGTTPVSQALVGGNPGTEWHVIA